jgi:hypothetical protein
MEAVGRRLATFASRLGVLAAAAVALCTLAPVESGGKGIALFSWHPILMSAAFLGAMGSGVIAYIGPLEEKKANRERHRALQISAAVLALLGTAAIMLNKVRHGKSVVPKSPHAWFGALTMVLVMGQSSVGLSKYSQVLKRGLSDCKFHGDMGRATFALGAVTIALGIRFTFAGWVQYSLLALTQTSAVVTVLISMRCYPNSGRYATLGGAARDADMSSTAADDDS